MYMHGLILLIGLNLILGIAKFSIADSSKKVRLNKVADFDDIVERNFDRVHYTSDVQDPVWEPYDLHRNQKIKHSKNRLNRYHDIRNRQLQDDKTDSKNSLSDILRGKGQFSYDQSNPKHSHQNQGYYYVRNIEEPNVHDQHEVSTIKSDTRSDSMLDAVKKSSEETIPAKKRQECHEMRKLFEDPLMENILMNTLLYGPPINHKWKTLRYIMKELNPNTVQLELLDKPEGRRCVEEYIKRRNKRHATAATMKRKEKKIKLLRRDAKEGSCFNWKPEEDPRFKSVVDFLIKNRLVHDDKFTYVPVVFKTVTAIPHNSDSEGTNNFPFNNKVAITDSTTECGELDILSQPSTTNNLPQIQAITSTPTTLISIASPSQSPTYPSVSQSPETQISTVPPMNTLFQKAKNLTEELRFRIPQLRRSFEEGSASPQTVTETSASVSPLPMNTQSTTISTSSEATQSYQACDPKIMPGVLIYPIDTGEKPKRSIEDIIEKELMPTKPAELPEQVLLQSINPEVADFNPVHPIKKDTCSSCDRETNNLLDLLANIQADLPKENHNSPGSDGTTITQSNLDQSATTLTNNGLNSRETKDQSVSNNLGDTNFNEGPMLSDKDKAAFVDFTIPDLSNLLLPDASFLPSSSFTETYPSITAETTQETTQETTHTYPVMTQISETFLKHSTTTASNQPTSNRDIDLKLKLKRLENDLKLVNEVQNILNGMNNPDQKVRNKREVQFDEANPDDNNQNLLDITLKIKTDPPSKTHIDVDDDTKSKEVSGLGKILSWKHSLSEKCRFKRRHKKKKKRKYKTGHRNQRFLDQGYQNSQ